MSQPPESNSPDHAEEYAHGYDSALTLKMHASRTAAKQAGWFLPYLQPGMSLLDCGCATGSITIGLAQAVAPGGVTGIDISEIEIERARARAAEEGVQSIRFAVGNIYQLDFPDNHFDALFSHNVLEHVSEPDRALREMHRILKPGGIIGIRNTDLGGVLLSPTDKLLERFLVVYEADWEGVNGHPRLGRRLGGLLTTAGFTDVEPSASYETYHGPDGRSFHRDIAVGRLSEPDFVERVIGRGLTTVDELEAMKAAWFAWTERSDAFFAVSHGEAVGRKI